MKKGENTIEIDQENELLVSYNGSQSQMQWSSCIIVQRNINRRIKRREGKAFPSFKTNKRYLGKNKPAFTFYL